eukprot:m.329378 g.329378  ORF g.329378 m.329378 type:complete len:600 (+) comp16036_c0_seq29:1865-3664(+)
MAWLPFTFYDYDAINQTAVRKTVYCDQIIEGSNKQDASGVLATLEAFLRAVRARLPFIRSVSLQSDNAGCYRSSFLLALIPVVSLHTGVTVTRFVHSETQDGKCLIDAHFAQGTHHCVQYLKTGKDVATASELYCALASHGGIPNSFVQLIRLNGARQSELLARHNTLSKRITTQIGRVNDVSFLTEDIMQHDEYGSSRDIEMPTFMLQAFEYSNIGQGMQCLVSLEKQTLQCFLQTKQAQSTHDPSFNADNTGASSDAADDDDDAESEPDIGATDTQAGETDGDASRTYMHYTLVSHTTLDVILGPRRYTTRVPTNDETASDGGDESDSSTEPTTTQRRDLVACAVRLANDMILHHSTIRDGGAQDIDEYNLASGIAISRPQGWARRPKTGETYGAKYMEAYRQDVEALFQIGVNDTSNKISPSAMLEALREKYPGRYSLPGESDITSVISSLLQKQKRVSSRPPAAIPLTTGVTASASLDHPQEPGSFRFTAAAHNGEAAVPTDSLTVSTVVAASSVPVVFAQPSTHTQVTAKSRVRIPQVVVGYMSDILRLHPTAKPAMALKLVKERVVAEHGCLPDWLPSDLKLKSKISNMKAKH